MHIDSHSSGLSALVVDDNGLIALDTREVLIELGFPEVHIAADGGEALARLAHRSYDWALVDGTLKGGDLECVVGRLDEKGIPLVFVCSQPDGSDIAVERDGRLFIARPYGKKNLAALILPSA
ncbi:response regulator receiver domain-containing protein [Novosphingobium kunmingense]|uniref:Response regulator receiver domain-containing protein n=1 Tax=Novosphingobium kunmingense TaxID=1211806 RepID=A0A2N0H663_9SPHN|nr:response regulator [Novosphingobium kunmingense]PKB14423.1 response regulator receiver domain-containing protein [Novosphingobium kunmingense]